MAELQKPSVDYGLLDPFKLKAQEAAALTDGNVARLGLEVVRESRGESAFLVRSVDGHPPKLIGGVPEGLGTKSLVADAIRASTGRTFYDDLACDTVAMNVNDLATLGVVPIVVGPHIAVSSADWFKDEQRSTDLIWGWKNACDVARCVYGPGETPALSGLVEAGRAILSGFGLGVIKTEERRIRGDITDGDVILFLESSGIHANGLSEARLLASRIENGYDTNVCDGVTFGEALMTPTTIYSALVEDCLEANLNIHYGVNITGHGWRKLMRAVESFDYIVDEIPERLPLFEFLQNGLRMDNERAYGTFNMGAGFAVYLPESDARQAITIAELHGIRAWVAGYLEKSKLKRVVISQLGVEYLASSLQVRR